MSEADTYVQDLARLREIETTLRKELNHHQAEEARALEDALRQLMLGNEAAAQRARDSHSDAAQQARQKAIEAGRMATEVAQQIARNEKLQENTLSRLRSAERAGHLASVPETERLRRDEARHVRQLERLTHIAELRYKPLRSPAAEKLRVLYLTTDPYLDLMTELEVRQVQQALQGAKYRDRVEVQLRPAATFPDLIAALNSVRPHIVHFSGHTGEVFRLDDGDVMPGANGVDFTSLVRALVASDRPPELLVLNACGPIKRAMPVLPAVPVVIGLSDSILDTAAIVFSQQFYAAIASGQSVGAAFRHGRSKVEAVLLEDDASEPPECITRDDVDFDALVLVRPSPVDRP
jgi:hypothetical protein